jgi:predicted ATP-grasp superfamily ATP-dependent carboligase
MYQFAPLKAVPAQDVQPQSSSRRPPVLLFMGDFYGSLAAVRCFGREGIPVTVADPKLLSPARWSRFATRSLLCPPVQESGAFMEWLLDFGRREPGHVLCPSNDDTAWLFARYRDELAPYFRIFQPNLPILHRILNKRLLATACRAAKLDVCRTWFPETDDDLEFIAREARFPVLIKPVTQVLYTRRDKGQQVNSPLELRRAYEDYGADYGKTVLDHDRSVSHPMVQEFEAAAVRGIYNLSGFVDERGEVALFRAGVKVLQRPRRLGVGICFEAAPVREDLAAKVVELCRHVGYYGVLEVEFIQKDDRHLLIDFNPRFYNQMAFDIERGLPLPLLYYWAALGRREEIRRIREDVDRSVDTKGVYTHRFAMEIMLRAQRLSGALSAAERESWSSWLRTHSTHRTDAVLDLSDPLPSIFDVASTVYLYARHPGSFLRHFIRSIVLNRD